MKPNDNMVMIVFVAAACLMACVGIIMDTNNKSPQKPIQKPIQKPFIITGKDIQNWNYTGETNFEYTDANGNVVNFTDTAYKYNIGDTIK